MKLLFTVSIIFTLTAAVAMAKKKKGSYSDSSDEFAFSYEDDKNDQTLDQKGDLNTKFVILAVLTEPHKSVVCSPVSAMMPLAKMALGADGSTLSELLSAIGVRSKSKISKKFKKLIRTLQNLPGVELTVASRLYLSDQKRLKSSFKKDAKNIFRSSVEQTDFLRPVDAAKSINKWINSETRGKIPTIIRPDEIAPSSSIIIANAVYFAGEWTIPFSRVEPGSFYTPWGAQRISMMKNNDHYSYYKSDSLSAQIIELPYKGNAASLVIVLPSTRDGLPVLLNALKLAPSLLTTAMKRMRSAKVKLTIPKFKTETELDLGVLYEKIGVRNIFMRGSGLNGIIKGETVYVSKAIQKAVIEVTQHGTEAAAAAVLNVEPLMYQKLEHFTANHPFVFFIKARHQQLFAGTFVKGY